MQLPITDDAIPIPPETDFELAIVDLEKGTINKITVPPTSLLLTVRIPTPLDAGSSLFKVLVPKPHTLITSQLSQIHTTLSLPLSPHYGPVTFKLDPNYDGIAETSGSSIRFSTAYIERLGGNQPDKELQLNEVAGVILHELVHVVQWDGKGSAPWWWIEGLADFVRLRGGLAPPHWCKPGEGENYDKGYDTTARFLDWVEDEGEGFCSNINSKLRDSEWNDKWWEELTGRKVEELWKEYKKVYEKTASENPPAPVPTHAAHGYMPSS